MHTSASAMRSSLPATDLLDNDTRKAQLQRENVTVTATAAVTSSFFVWLPPTLLSRFYYEG